MPDISMCGNTNCPFRMKCFRYTAIPSEFRQAYSSFKPNENSCDYFIDNKGTIINKNILEYEQNRS